MNGFDRSQCERRMEATTPVIDLVGVASATERVSEYRVELTLTVTDKRLESVVNQGNELRN